MRVVRRPGRAAHGPVLARRGAGRTRRAVGGGVARCARRRRAARDGRRRVGRGVARSTSAALDARRRRAGRRLPRAPPATRSASCRPRRRRRLRALLRRGGRHAARRPRALRRRASTAPGASRCASASACASTSSCRPRPATTRSCSRSGRSTASRSRTCFDFLTPAQRASRSLRAGAARTRRCSRCAGAGTPAARSRCSRQRGGAQGAAADPAHASRRPAGRRVPGAGRLPGERRPGRIEIPDHPLVRQTMHDCLHEAMDVDGLAACSSGIESGRDRAVHVRDTTEPSPLAHEILNGQPYTFLDDAPLEERRTRAVALRRALPEDARELGALDPEAIERVRERSVARAARRRGAARRAARAWWSLPAPRRPMAAVVRGAGRGGGRAARAATQTGAALVRGRAAAPRVDALFPGAPIEPDVRAARGARGRARRATRTRAIGCRARPPRGLGPLHGGRAGARGSASPRRRRRGALPGSRREGFVLRGRFIAAQARTSRSSATGACSPASTATRSTGCGARSSRSPRRTSCASCCAGSTSRRAAQLEGRAGLLDVIAQLQGFEIAAGVLGARRAARARPRLSARVARRAVPVAARSPGRGSRAPQRRPARPGERRGRGGATPSRATPVTLRRARRTCRGC